MKTRLNFKQRSNKYWFKSLLISCKNFIIDNYITLIISTLVLLMFYYLYRRKYNRYETKGGFFKNSTIEKDKNKVDAVIDKVGDKVEKFAKLSADKAVNTFESVKDTLTGKTLSEAEAAKAAAELLAEKYKTENDKLKQQNTDITDNNNFSQL
jgi:hypothetical protein